MKDAPQASDGGRVVLLVGDYDPPTMDYYHAIEALRKEKGVEDIWACPIEPEDKERARELTMAFCAEVSARSPFSPRGRSVVGCCTVGIDRNLDADGLASWCRQRYPTLGFEAISIGDLRFAGERGEGVKVAKLLRVGTGVRERVFRGLDESRSFTPGTWALIQSRRYYR